MKKSRLPIAASLMALGFAAPATAADLRAPVYAKAPPMNSAIYDWSGLYIGLNGGGGSSHNCWEMAIDHVVGPFGGAPGTHLGCHDATGGTFGGQIGYRWQAAQWVFGLEGQGNWADFSGSNVNLLDGRYTDRSRIDSFGLFTGQIGYAVNNVLLYMKGGAAVVSNKYDAYIGGQITDTARETRWGGTVGAGLEIGFAPNWSIGVEYDHIFLSDKDVDFTAGPARLNYTGVSYTDRISQDIDMAVVRLNYKFGARY
jgi:outer membrane immunogenic protein